MGGLFQVFWGVQLLSRVWLFATPWTAARQASLSITNSQSLLKLMSIKWVMTSNHLTLCCPFLLPSILPSIKVFSNESVLPTAWSKYWSFSFSISPSSEYSGLISFRIDWFDLLTIQRTLKSSPTPQFKSSILRHSAFLTVFMLGKGWRFPRVGPLPTFWSLPWDCYGASGCVI